MFLKYTILPYVSGLYVPPFGGGGNVQFNLSNVQLSESSVQLRVSDVQINASNVVFRVSNLIINFVK